MWWPPVVQALQPTRGACAPYCLFPIVKSVLAARHLLPFCRVLHFTLAGFKPWDWWAGWIMGDTSAQWQVRCTALHVHCTATALLCTVRGGSWWAPQRTGLAAA